MYREHIQKDPETGEYGGVDEPEKEKGARGRMHFTTLGHKFDPEDDPSQLCFVPDEPTLLDLATMQCEQNRKQMTPNFKAGVAKADDCPPCGVGTASLPLDFLTIVIRGDKGGNVGFHRWGGDSGEWEHGTTFDEIENLYTDGEYNGGVQDGSGVVVRPD